MHVHRFGDGEEVHYFGIHGWGGGFRTYEPVAPYLPENASLWSVDLPGYGNSPALDEWHWERVADALERALEALPRKLRLIGNCSGAAFGLALALRQPQRFEHLFLIDPFAYSPWYFKLLVARGPGRFFYATAFENPIGRWMTNRGLAEHRTEDSDLTASFEELDHGVVYEYLRMLHQIPGYRTFEDLQHPIVIAHGENTFEAVRKSVQMWKEMWPNARTVEIAGAGHLPIEEATEAMAANMFADVGVEL